MLFIQECCVTWLSDPSKILTRVLQTKGRWDRQSLNEWAFLPVVYEVFFWASERIFDTIFPPTWQKLSHCIPHDTNYPITSSQAWWLVTTKMHTLEEIRTRRWFNFAGWRGILKSVGAAGRYCSFLVLAKWLKFSAHCAFPFVFFLFAQNRSRERRKGLGAREITAICQMRNTTTRRANTTRNTITKLSLERKRNLSTNWLPRNPKKG